MGVDRDLLPAWGESAVASTIEILESLGVDAIFSGELAASPAGLGGAYVPVDTAGHTYVLGFISPPSLSQKLIRDVLGWVQGDNPAGHRDAMGEISNMIAGTTKGLMARLEGPDVTLGLPMYLNGEYLGTSAVTTRRTCFELEVLGDKCCVVVIQQQLSGEAVRRREVERQLRDSEQRQRAIIEAAPDAVITCNRVGEVDTFNSAAEKMFGYASGEVIGASVHKFLEVSKNALSATSRHVVGSGRTKSGNRFPIEASISSYEFRETEYRALIIRDITQREAARWELAEANRRTVKLSHAAGKAEVAADVLHNVGNVLNSINISTSILLEQLRVSREEPLMKLSELLKSEAEDLGHFFSHDPRAQKILPFLELSVKRLTDSRLQHMKEVTNVQSHVDHIKRVIMTQQLIASAAGMMEEIDFLEVVGDALVHVQPLIQGGNVSVDRREPSGGLQLTTDKNKVIQIVINLLKNACESLGEAEPDQSQLILSTSGTDDQLVFEVQDNGVGIDAEGMKRLFSHGYTTKRDGHGFGLHGCALFAKQLGGALEAHSPGPKRGALFRLTLPLTPPAGVQVSSPPND